jgi:hypothetical protein
MSDFTYTVTVSGCTQEQADQVMNERINVEEDYGFAYQISYTTEQASDGEEFPTSTCGCGHEIVYYGEDEGWQHNVAPYVWGDDHDAHPDEEGKRAAEAYDREHSTYKIKRFYQGDYETEVIETGLSYEDAVAHCNDPETSSKTTTNAAGLALTRERGEWFDGHERE